MFSKHCHWQLVEAVADNFEKIALILMLKNLLAHTCFHLLNDGPEEGKK